MTIKRTRTQVAEDLVTYCRVYVRNARRAGYVSMFTTDLIWAMADEHGIDPSLWSMRTVKAIARRRARDTDETHLLDLGKDPAVLLTPTQRRAFLAIAQHADGTLSRGTVKGIALPTLQALDRLGLVALTVEAGSSHWTATVTGAGRRALGLISAIHG